MLSVTFDRPQFTGQQAVAIARERYGLETTARSLSSERDQNFHLETTDGRAFVLKIAHALEDPAVLDLQNRALGCLARAGAPVRVPRLHPAKTGEPTITIAGLGGTTHLVRLVGYVPGTPLAEVKPHTPQLLRSLGRAVGALSKALAGFEHPAADRELKWDLRRATWIRDYVSYVDSSAHRGIVTRFLSDFEAHVLSRASALRTSIVYNDANDYNVLVGGDDPYGREVVALIDFGDMLRSWTVADLAVAVAYAMLDKPDPVGAAVHVVRGYYEECPLTETELETLFYLVCTRLSVSVVNSAYQRRAEPGNQYLTISERPAWAALEMLESFNPRLAHYLFRDACGLPACPRSPGVARWLASHGGELGPVLEPDPRTSAHVVFDLGVGSAELTSPQEWEDPASFSRLLFDRMRLAGARVGVGRYDEARPFYSTPLFKSAGNDGPEWRTVHLGMDLFVEPGTPVRAPLDGVVHNVANNRGALDYGPTVILEHGVVDGPSFYTLYGHLAGDSVAALRAGMPVHKGEVIARVGEGHENGGWPPHLHFQVITDLLDRAGEFPGVARPRDRRTWLSLSPDPNLVVRVPDARPAEGGMSGDAILALRARHIGRSLSVSYRRPLTIVRGYMQHLYDDEGRAYLDAVNNVAHVGHCHPRVVRAGQQQMAILNTNTRYLHERLARYAERLTATLPEPLRVCFFVCSGSEANELALRLARTRTGRDGTIVVEVGYHGNTTTLIQISPYKFDGPGGSGAPRFVQKVPLPDDYRGPYRRNDPLAGEKYAAHVGEAIDRLDRAGLPAGAFICESMPGCAGQIVLPAGYLAEAYRLVREAGGVCIADEVQTGFGRVGSHFWAFETQGVVPDIVTLGKPIGNGHPLGAVVTTPEIAEAFANGMEYFNTFGGNPVSCAIGLAVLDVIEEERLQAHASRVGARLMGGLRSLMARHAIVGDVRGAGLFVGVELVRDRDTREPATAEASYVANRMRDRAILISTDGPFRNVLKIKPPMVFTEADADELVATLDWVLGENYVSRSAT